MISDFFFQIKKSCVVFAYYIVFLSFILFFQCFSDALDNADNDKEAIVNNMKALNVKIITPSSYPTKETLINLQKIFQKNSNLLNGVHKDEIINSLVSKESYILWAIRGGYGASKLINSLEGISVPESQKLLIGYSDVTALQLFAIKHWNWIAIHGAMVADLDTKKDLGNFNVLLKILNKEIFQISLDDLQIIDESKIQSYDQYKEERNQRLIHGKIIGGNLSIIQTSIGTNWEINTDEKILFLEDVNINYATLLRTLIHLKQANIINSKTRAIILGQFTGIKKNDLYYVAKTFQKEIDLPIFISQSFGHGYKNIPIVMNTDAYIEKNISLRENQVKNLGNNSDIYNQKYYKCVMNLEILKAQSK